MKYPRPLMAQPGCSRAAVMCIAAAEPITLAFCTLSGVVPAHAFKGFLELLVCRLES